MTLLHEWLKAKTAADVIPPGTPADGERLTADARQEGLAGLLLEHATRFDLPLPPAVASELNRFAAVVAARNLQLAAELERIVRVLNRAAVPVMLLKGAALNLTLYPRPDLRPMSDLDLLVRPEDAEKAVRSLIEAGCRRGMDLVREGFFPRYHCECELIAGSVVPVRIDLHARPLRPLRLARTFPADSFWDDARTIAVGESEAWIPAPRTMFIHLAAHAAFHGCARLLWLYDLKRLAEDRHRVMDWPFVVRQSNEWALALPVQRAIEHATDHFGPFCPPDVLSILGGQPTSWRDRLTLWQAPRDAASPLAHVAVNLLCAPGLGFRLGYLAAYLRPGRAHLASIYPYRHRGWELCAHAWRAVRLVGRIVKTPWRTLLVALRLLRRAETPRRVMWDR